MVVIDGKQYEKDDLTDEQIQLVDHIRDLNGKFEKAQFEATQYKVASDAFTQMLLSTFADQEESANEATGEQEVEEVTAEPV